MVRAIVQRKEYLGMTVNFKTSRPGINKSWRKNPEEKQMIFPNTHEALVDAETWQAAQRIIRSQQDYIPKPSPVFNGLMYCGECRARMHLRRCSADGRYDAYACSTHRHSAAYPMRLCSYNSIRVSTVSDMPPYNWKTDMVRAVVQRKEYLGMTVNFKTSRPGIKKSGRKNPEEKQMIFPNTHEALVDTETWQAAQRIIHQKQDSLPKPAPVFNGLMYCGECGARMHLRRSSTNSKYDAYACSTHRHSVAYPVRLCSYNSIRVSTVSDIAKQIVQDVSRYAVIDEDGFRKQLEREANHSQAEKQRPLEKTIRAKEKRIAELERLLKKLYEDYALGRISEERFMKLSADYEREEADVKEAIISLRNNIQEIRSSHDRTEQFIRLAREYRNCAEVTDDMIRAFVDKIVVHRTGKDENGQQTRAIEVHLKFIGQFIFPNDRAEQ